jgi:two-component system chemotaxis response regulator CheY
MGFDFKKLSILLVEDTVALRKLVTSVLDTLGVGDIQTADDGDSGYEAYCNNPPDIIVADWHMLPMSGLDMVRKIRNDPESPNPTIPIIMITGFSAYSRVELARDVGVTEFLVQPFSATDMARRIGYVINNPRDFIRSSDFFGPDRRRAAQADYGGPDRRNNDLSYL